MINLAIFEKILVFGQKVLPDRSIFKVDKSSWKMPQTKNSVASFGENVVCIQTVLPDMSTSKSTKVDGKCQNLKFIKRIFVFSLFSKTGEFWKNHKI